MSSSDLLSAAQVADLAGISPGELYSYVQRRQAPRPTTRVLGRPMWSRADVEAWFGIEDGDEPDDDDDDELAPPTRIW